MTELEQATEIIRHHNQCSQVFIQRKLKVGYLHAGRIIDELEAAGAIGPATEGCRERDVKQFPEQACETK